MKPLLKGLFHGVSLAIAFPFALTSGFGRIEPIYYLWAQACALLPGLPGDYLRVAYYHLTLTECSLESCIQFGSFFSHPQAKLGRGVYVGPYSILGRSSIGDGSQISSAVQILSGRRQHARDAEGRLSGAEHGVFEEVVIGKGCWIGAGAIVMADVGANSTIGAGAVVTKPIPPDSVAVGNPARVIKTLAPQA